MNPLLESNAKLNNNNDNPRKFIVPENGSEKDGSIDVGSDFVVIATVSHLPESQFSQMNKGENSISLALRNRFLTIQFEANKINENSRKEIAKSIIEKEEAKISKSHMNDNDGIPSSLRPNLITDPAVIDKLSECIAKAFTDETPIRQIAKLSNAVALGYGIIEYTTPEAFIQACNMNTDWLASDSSETLVNRTVDQFVIDPTFYYKTEDKHSPMWQTISALSLGSATSQHVFLQGPPGSGKTVAVRHFSENRVFNQHSPVYSVACSAETTKEQFFGSIIFESNGFRFNDGPLVQAAKEGAVFLADEFNLLPQNVMLSLLPFLSGKAGDITQHPDIPNNIIIAPGFLFVATGNEDNERGRNKLPDYIKNLLHRIVVNIGSDDQNNQIELFVDLLLVLYNKELDHNFFQGFFSVLYILLYLLKIDYYLLLR